MSGVALWTLVRKFGPYFVVAAFLVGIYTVGYSKGKAKWKDKYNVAVAERKAMEVDRDAANIGWERSRRSVAICNERTADFSADSAARISRLESALAEKPEVITEYVEAGDAVETVIVSQDCTTALSEAAKVLKGVDPP